MDKYSNFFYSWFSRTLWMPIKLINKQLFIAREWTDDRYTVQILYEHDSLNLNKQHNFSLTVPPVYSVRTNMLIYFTDSIEFSCCLLMFPHIMCLFIRVQMKFPFIMSMSLMFSYHVAKYECKIFPDIFHVT